MTEPEPQHVQDARQVIREWQQRNGHDSYVDCLGSGWRGYQAACHDCGWRGPEHLRGDEEMGTDESRVHKSNARQDAAHHRVATMPGAAA